MIIVFPHNIGLATTVLLAIVIATAAVAAFPTLRWGWKAWPLVLGIAFAIPVLVAGVLMVALPLVADRIEVTGFFVNTTTLILTGLSSALLGSGIAMTLLLVRSRVR